MESPQPTPAHHPGHPAGEHEATISAQVLAKARTEPATLLQDHTGWFVESLFTQTLIIHVIRTRKIPFIQSWASWPLIVSSLIIVTVGAWLTVSPLAGTLGFVPLPPLYWLLLAIMLPCYVILTQIVKTWFYRKYGD